MNKFLSIIAIFLISSLSITAIAQFRYGVRLGGDINTSSLTKAPSYRIKHLSGFSGGVTFEYQFENNPWAFDASLMYTYTGIKLKEKADDTKSWKLGNHFLELPVHAKFKLPLHITKDLVSIYAFTGPSFMYRINKQFKDSPIETNRFQMGWDVGAGIDIINFLQVQAGYRFGLNNVINNNSNLSNACMRNDGVNITVAILFDF